MDGPADDAASAARDATRAPAPPPCIVALDMGYGHLRAAAALAAASGGRVLEADRAPIAAPREEDAWRRARRFYIGLSRAADSGWLPGARRLLDAVTAIPEARRDPAAPNLATRTLARFVRGGLGAGLAEHLRRTGAPLVATFYAPAIAAEAHGAERVHLVVTDCDVNRVWVPADPRRSRITYLAPTEAAAERVRSYGVDAARVHVTGFPLPPALVGDDDGERRRAFARRLARLDPRGTFRRAHAAELRDVVGDVPGGPSVPPTLVFAVGGAGAQRDVARILLDVLREPLARGELRLVLVAGTRPDVAAAFARWIDAAGAGAGASVVFERTFDAYLARFDAALAGADALWTKPSELTFYGALGLPLLLGDPLGVHERRNRAWALSLGAALDAADARATAARLPGLLADGTLAAVAWSGFRAMPSDGTRRILETVRTS